MSKGSSRSMGTQAGRGMRRDARHTGGVPSGNAAAARLSAAPPRRGRANVTIRCASCGRTAAKPPGVSAGPANARSGSAVQRCWRSRLHVLVKNKKKKKKRLAPPSRPGGRRRRRRRPLGPRSRSGAGSRGRGAGEAGAPPPAGQRTRADFARRVGAARYERRGSSRFRSDCGTR